MSYNSLLTNRCTIERYTSVNTDGVVVKKWAELATNVHCLLQETSGRMLQQAGGQGLFVDADLYLKIGQDVKPRTTDDSKDRIIMTKPNTGAIFLVEVVVDSSGQVHHLQALLKRVPAE